MYHHRLWYLSEKIHRYSTLIFSILIFHQKNNDIIKKARGILVASPLISKMHLLLWASLGRHPCFESITISLCLENIINFSCPETMLLFCFCFLLGRRWFVLHICLTKLDQNCFILTRKNDAAVYKYCVVSFALSVQNKAQHRHETTGKCQLHQQKL